MSAFSTLICICFPIHNMDLLRTLVSGKKKRLRERGYDLDLSYITPRIIAMSFPAQGFEKLYRNSCDTVAKFLNETHPGDYRIFNLSGMKFDYTKFGENVAEYPWLDHHSPPIDLLFKACADMHEWLSRSDGHVTVINCRAGKGRTGTLICCYMMFCGRFSDPNQTMKYYRYKRFTNGGGVTQPSQVRYVRYFAHILHQEIKGPMCKILKKLVFHRAPRMSNSGCRPYVELFYEDQLVYSSKEAARERNLHLVDDWTEPREHDIPISSHLILKGDLLFKVYHWGRLGAAKICRFAINTAFIEPDSTITLGKLEIDPYSLRKSRKIADDFHIKLVFCEVCQCDASMDFDDRCRFCTETMGITEISRWESVHSIIKQIHQDPKDPVRLLFGIHVDDVESTLLREVEAEHSEEEEEVETPEVREESEVPHTSTRSL